MANNTLTKRLWELLGSPSEYYDMPFAPPKILVDLIGADASSPAIKAPSRSGRHLMPLLHQRKLRLPG